VESETSRFRCSESISFASAALIGSKLSSDIFQFPSTRRVGSRWDCGSGSSRAQGLIPRGVVLLALRCVRSSRVQIRVGPLCHHTMFGDTATAGSRLLPPNFGIYQALSGGSEHLSSTGHYSVTLQSCVLQYPICARGN